MSTIYQNQCEMWIFATPRPQKNESLTFL